MTRLPVSTRFALRSLFRNARRCGLSIAGVAVGCSVALANIAIARGKVDLFVRNIAEGGVGHFRVVPAGWAAGHDPSLRLAAWREELARARALAGVKAAAPRARLQAMLAMGTRAVGVELVGVEPAAEPATFRYVRELSAGRYLRGEDTHAMVVGRALAERLRADVGDSLVVTGVDRSGEVKSEMFEVVGIVSVGSRQLESSICQVSLRDIELLSGLPGAGEIAVVLDRPDGVERAMSRLRPELPRGDTLLSWQELRPDSRAAIDLNVEMARVLTIALVFVAFVGVASAQLTAILERRRELAVLSALGVSARRLVSLVLSEALILGTLSWAATVALSGPLLWHYARAGFSVLPKSQALTFLGAVIDPVFHLDFGNWFFAYAAFLAYASTLAASVYPAVFAVRLDPAEALRVAQ